MAVTRDQVIWSYRILLGREPESDGVIDDKMGAASLADLRATFLASPEFQARNAETPPVDNFADVDTLDVEIAASPAQAARMLDNIRREWRRFGETEPHWSVLTSEQFRSERIGQTLDLFYQTGRDHLRSMLNPIARAGLPIARFGRVLDFGCGVGRLTLALAERADHVLGIDISPAHVALASERAMATGAGNTEFRAIDDLADLDGLGGFDLVVSFIVLQHNPPPVMALLLRKLLETLDPGGVAIVQLPTYIVGQRFVIEDYLAHKQPPMEMNALPQHEVFAIVEAAGCRMLEVQQDNFMGNNGGLSHTFAIRKHAQAHRKLF